MSFVHLHNHTQYSLLDGACRIDKMINMALDMKMPAVAMTDHGNMFGAIDFYMTAKKKNIKPIIGIEAYIINGELDREKSKKAERYHLVLLAKNLTGYKNLMKLTSISYIDGFYQKPRINKATLKKYSDGLICLSACPQGEIPKLLQMNKKKKAKKVIDFYKKHFPERFYLELQDHGLDIEKNIAPRIIELANETNTPLVVTNDCHYLKKEDSQAHDILLCIQTGKKLTDKERLKYKTNQLYFKSETEMRKLFPDLEEAYSNTVKIANEINLELDYNKFLFPKPEIPDNFKDNYSYLKHLVYKGAKKKYSKIDEKVEERIKFELNVIHKMGYDSYFLVVKDFIDTARKLNVTVGPGRGSAAGSIVAYTLDITQLDPLKYGLLFERFLDLERVGMPDIDIDFDDEGREKIIDYVVNKYGRKSVTQIITFGKLGARSVIKDVARVLDVSATQANKITKQIPDDHKITLEKALKQSPEFKKLMNSSDKYKKIIKNSLVLEGLVRHTSVHAAGVVIVPGDLTDFVPLATSRKNGDKPIILVQYEGKWLETLKMLKMDFLGLKTLTLIKNTVKLVKEHRNIDIDIKKIELSDKKTYKLFSKGHTDGVFQFESSGMKKYLKKLKPNAFNDLIAMVALYRPGPMDFIDKFINRKHGKENISYDHPLTKNALKETYGVTVYQEQVMQISKDMADFTGAEAGTLRKAISKKKENLMKEMAKKFKDGAAQKGVSKAVIDKIWNNWQKFANYAFNKSHAACYAYVAYQTAYLKAHYPVEFMATLLSLEKEPTKIPHFIHECKKMNIEVIKPNVNKSYKKFKVNGNKIHFGLKAIKNVGGKAIDNIIKVRKKGKFTSIFDFCSRIDLRLVNKAVLESLISAGAMDDLEGSRSQKYKSVEKAIEHGADKQREKKNGQLSFFDKLEDSKKYDLTPNLPKINEWDTDKKLLKEKEILGFYWSDHPLCKYKFLPYIINTNSQKAAENPDSVPKTIYIAGIIDKIVKKTTRNKKDLAILIFEDLYGKFELSLINEDYEKYYNLVKENKIYFVIAKKSNYYLDDNLLRLKPVKIFPIEAVDTELSGKIDLIFNESDIGDDLTHKFKKEIKQNQGNFNINISILTKKYKVLRMKVKNKQIFPNSALLDFLKKDMNAVIKIKVKRR